MTGLSADSSSILLSRNSTIRGQWQWSLYFWQTWHHCKQSQESYMPQGNPRPSQQ
jgi:hypothetical protein